MRGTLLETAPKLNARPAVPVIACHASSKDETYARPFVRTARPFPFGSTFRTGRPSTVDRVLSASSRLFVAWASSPCPPITLAVIPPPGSRPKFTVKISLIGPLRSELDYLHANPCRKGLVPRPEQWWFSSAACYAGEKACCLEVDRLEL